MKVLLVILTVVIVTALVATGAGWLWWQSQLKPVCADVTATSCQKQSFVIPKGQSVQVIGQRLQEAGLIKSALAFRIHARVSGLNSRLQAGSFSLSPAASTPEVAQSLTEGTEDMWITLLEGWRKEEMAEYLETQELPEFDAAEFLQLAADSEGYLYPDTYLIPRQSTADYVFSLLTNTFEAKVTTGLKNEIAASEYEQEDVIIMASIVEREGRGLQQMKEVAGILWNRLDIGMPLQADATLQYSKGYDKQQKTWWPVPLAADKELNSPYNTYKNATLPPGPISNPSLDAVKATLSPLETDNLYYIHDQEGRIHPAQTLEQHNANIQKYLR